MARVFIDGFESGNYTLWDATYNASIVAASGYAMDGNYCVNLGQADYLVKTLPESSEYYFGFLYRIHTSVANAEIVFCVRNGSTVLCTLCRDRAIIGAFEAYRGSRDGLSPSGVLLESGSAPIVGDVTYHVGVYIKIDDTVGRFKVVVDGVTDIDFTGDTQVGADILIDNVLLGNTSAYAATYACFDNFVVDDSEIPEQTSIQAIVPTAPGTTTEWTPSTGANWSCVDEKPAVDTDYISVNALNKIDTYETGNLAGTIVAVKAVQVQARIAYEGAPTPTHIQLGVRSNSTDCFADNKTPAVSFTGNHSRILNTDPSDLSAWDETKVNALEIGVKAVA